MRVPRSTYRENARARHFESAWHVTARAVRDSIAEQIVRLLCDLRTELANRDLAAPYVDLQRYPAHLHIGVLPEWRRRGIGTALMSRYAGYLREQGVPGFHLYASSFHPLGVAFYRKLGLEVLGEFQWRFHNGAAWGDVVETIFGRDLGG